MHNWRVDDKTVTSSLTYQLHASCGTTGTNTVQCPQTFAKGLIRSCRKQQHGSCSQNGFMHVIHDKFYC